MLIANEHKDRTSSTGSESKSRPALLLSMQGSSADTVELALLTRLKPASQEGLAPVPPGMVRSSDRRIVRGDMAIYIATNHDPVQDPPCPVCKGGGVDWKVRKDGQFDRRFKYSAHPCPACNGSGHRDGDWRARGTEVSPEFAALLRAHLPKRRPDAATLRRWIELGRIPED